MRLIDSVTVEFGSSHFTLNLGDYDEIRDETQEFEDHSEFTIACLKDGKVVRRLWNPRCDITYKGCE
jgi:hypothetical protein